jgi:hypothetical protein
MWAHYRSSVGSFNPMMRTEWSAGLVASTIANVNRTKNSPPFTITDFTPHYGEKAFAKEPITLDEAMKSWA